MSSYLYFPNGLPAGWGVYKISGISSRGDEINISEFSYTYESGASAYEDNFIIGIVDGYSVVDEPAEGIFFYDSADDMHRYGYWNNIANGYIFKETAAIIDDQIHIDFTELPELVSENEYVITLIMSNCTANQEESTTVAEGDSYEVIFTPNDGYSIETAPTGTGGGEGSIVDGNGVFTISSCNSDNEITCSAVADEPADELSPFVNIYNPTKTQLIDAAGTVFYEDSELVDTTQYIYKLYKTFVPVPSETVETIKFWKYDTLVNCNAVSDNIVVIDCGTISIAEYFENALDYEPNTDIVIWLPFIGFSRLNTNSFMGKSVHLEYSVDLMNGICAAVIESEDGHKIVETGTMYREEPYTSSVAPTLTDKYVNTALNMVERTPYIEITRPVNTLPDVGNMNPVSTNELVTLGDCSGYVRCSEVFIDGLNAYEEEKDALERMLKTGIII